jgi:protein-disulfide isomerase
MENHKKRKSSTMMIMAGIMAGLLVAAGFGAYNFFGGLYQLFGGVYQLSRTMKFFAPIYQQIDDWNWEHKGRPIPTQGQPSIGDSNAPVKLVEFGDFECYHCKAFHDQIFPQLKKDFIDTGKVEMYYINYASAGKSSTIAEAGESVFKQNQATFWKFYDAVYSQQKEMEQIRATPEFLEFLVGLVQTYIPEVDANQVSEDLKNYTYGPMVSGDTGIGICLEIHEVPKVFVNGKMVKDSLNYSALKKKIEDELKKE